MYFAFNNGIPSEVKLGEIYLLYSNPANFVINESSPNLHQIHNLGISKGISSSMQTGSPFLPTFS